MRVSGLDVVSVVGVCMRDHRLECCETLASSNKLSLSLTVVLCYCVVWAGVEAGLL